MQINDGLPYEGMYDEPYYMGVLSPNDGPLINQDHSMTELKPSRADYILHVKLKHYTEDPVKHGMLPNL